MFARVHTLGLRLRLPACPACPACVSVCLPACLSTYLPGFSAFACVRCGVCARIPQRPPPRRCSKSLRHLAFYTRCAPATPPVHRTPQRSDEAACTSKRRRRVHVEATTQVLFLMYVELATSSDHAARVVTKVSRRIPQEAPTPHANNRVPRAHGTRAWRLDPRTIDRRRSRIDSVGRKHMHDSAGKAWALCCVALPAP